MVAAVLGGDVRAARAALLEDIGNTAAFIEARGVLPSA
jgi:hypothetical protein